MPKTARKHFDEDINRARSILAHAEKLPSKQKAKALLRDDLLRSAWMHGVGAMDAYYCDAYADLLARILRAKNLQSDITLTGSIEKITFPVGSIFAPTNVRENWRWRSAARRIIERDNMVAMERIRDTFNSFLRHGQKLFEANVIDHLIMNLNAPQRLTGITPTNYRKLTGKPLASAKKAARKKIVARFRDIFQRRHDCIHNCDRPKLALQQLTPSSTKKVLQDIALLVEYCDSHFESEFNEYLRTVGANAQTRNAAGYSG